MPSYSGYTSQTDAENSEVDIPSVPDSEPEVVRPKESRRHRRRGANHNKHVREAATNQNIRLNATRVAEQLEMNVLSAQREVQRRHSNAESSGDVTLLYASAGIAYFQTLNGHRKIPYGPAASDLIEEFAVIGMVLLEFLKTEDD